MNTIFFNINNRLLNGQPVQMQLFLKDIIHKINGYFFKNRNEKKTYLTEQVIRARLSVVGINFKIVSI